MGSKEKEENPLEENGIRGSSEPPNREGGSGFSDEREMCEKCFV